MKLCAKNLEPRRYIGAKFSTIFAVESLVQMSDRTLSHRQAQAHDDTIQFSSFVSACFRSLQVAGVNSAFNDVGSFSFHRRHDISKIVGMFPCFFLRASVHDRAQTKTAARWPPSALSPLEQISSGRLLFATTQRGCSGQARAKYCERQRFWNIVGGDEPVRTSATCLGADNDI